MNQNNPRIGKKGGARRVAAELTKIRKALISPEVFSIVEKNKKVDQKKPEKKSTRTV